MADPADEKARLSGARGEFVASLGRRLQTLRHALRELEEVPNDRSRRDSLLRRVHALGAAARVLGFASVAEALQEAERALAERQRPRTKDLAEVSRVLDVLPSLVWGAPQSLRPGRPPSAAPEQLAGRQWPLSLLLFGGEELAVTLTRAVREDSVEFERAGEVEVASRAAQVQGPDLVLVDADHPDARVFLERLASDELAEPVNTIVVGDFNEPEAMREYSALGASRILKKPCNPETLRRTIEELSEVARERQVSHARPLGDVTLPALTRRIQAEIERGLLEAAVAGGQGTHVALGEGTEVMAAVWGALTRVRELVTLHSKGQVRFEPTGPEGAIPVAPWSREERRAGERGIGSTRDESDVPLSGRTVIVADDDPAVAWFLSGLLKTVGAEVVEAHDGFKALELARQDWPDLVVSDILMPGLDGFALCRELKQDVAVRDLPVILLSWKEDLLQRVRELGAGADGYLRKEAAASTVVQRIREVMRPRARVEARLEQGGEVRGRLDGLTPRLVLELCTKSQTNVRLEVIDAFFRYEVHVRRGQLISAKRLVPAASAAEKMPTVEGRRALSSLLGVNAGRFSVMPDESQVKADFSGSLREVLKPALDRARVAQAALAPGRLAEVTRIHFLEEELNAYLGATPDPMKTALMQLVGGMVPRQLLLGGISPELLERTLADVARRGCITHVDGPPGPERGDEPLGGPPAPAETGAAVPAASKPPAPSAGFQGSMAASSKGEVAQPGDRSARSPAAADSALPPSMPTASKASSAEPSRGPPAQVAVPPGGDDAKSTVAAPSPPPAPPQPETLPQAIPKSKAELEVKESSQVEGIHPAASKAAFSFQLSPEPPAPQDDSGMTDEDDIDDGAWFVSDSPVDAEHVNPAWPPESGTLPGVGESKKITPEDVTTRTPPPAHADRSAASGALPEAHRVNLAGPKFEKTPAGPEFRKDSATDLASAIALSTLEPPPPEGERPAPEQARLPKTKRIAFPKTKPTPHAQAKPQPEAERELSSTQVLETGEAAEDEPATEPERSDDGIELARTVLLVPSPEPPPKPVTRPVVEVAPALESTPEPEPEPKLADEPDAQPRGAPGAQRAAPPVDDELERVPEVYRFLEAQPSFAHQPEPSPAEADSEEREEGTPEPVFEEEEEPPNAEEASPSPVPSSARPSPSRDVAGSRRTGTSPVKLGKVGLVGVVAASAAVSYLAVSAARDWLGAPGLSPAPRPTAAAVDHQDIEPARAPTPAPSDVPLESQLSAPAPAAKPAESATPRSERDEVVITEEALPEGMALAPGKGVLKVVTPDAHAIYVDGEFAGRGPVRIVPLPPGKHQVKTRFEGEENSYAAEVKQGRLTRFAVGSE